MDYDHVLVPTDGEGEMEAVLEHVTTIANLRDATVHAVYVIDERQFPDPSVLDSEGGSDGATHQLREDSERRGERAVERVEEYLADRDLEVVTAVEYGLPARAICSYSRTNDVDVVVMATHGRSVRDRQLVGSVTDSVIRAGDVPVFVVPPSAGEAAR